MLRTEAKRALEACDQIIMFLHTHLQDNSLILEFTDSIHHLNGRTDGSTSNHKEMIATLGALRLAMSNKLLEAVGVNEGTSASRSQALGMNNETQLPMLVTKKEFDSVHTMQNWR